MAGARDQEGTIIILHWKFFMYHFETSVHQNVPILLIFSGSTPNVCNEAANAVLVNLPVGPSGGIWPPSHL